MKLSDHKKTMIFTSIVTILPILIGLLLWNQLPEQIATHFDSHGQPDDYSPKLFAVVGLPLLLLFAHWLSLVIITADPKKQNIHPKMFGLIAWFIPAMSMILCSATYFNALDMTLNVSNYIDYGLGVLFIVIGNYLPKCPQNYTIGLRLPWTLEDEENWGKTHRLGGYVFMTMGLVVIVASFFQITYIKFVALLLGGFIPSIYSYVLYIKKNNSEKE